MMSGQRVFYKAISIFLFALIFLYAGKFLATTTEGGRETRYGYDLDGNVVYKKLPNNVITRTDFDALGRRLKIRDLGGAAELSVFDYSSPGGAGWFSGHDKVGNVVKVLEKYTRAELKNRTVINSYDRANRLNIETLDERPAGSLTVTTYTHDAANNRTAKLKVVNGSTVENLVYTFGDATAATGANTNQLTGYGPSGSPQTHTFVYDANGNRITRATAGRSDIYTWDQDNRLVALNYQTDSNTAKRGEYRYAYDHRTRRVLRDESSITGGANTSITFSGGLSVQELTGTTITRHYIRGSDWGGGIGGVLYSVDGSNAPLFDHYNSRGDVIGQTDASALVTWQAAYEAYGTKVEGGTTATRQKANTKDEDPHGLLNEGFRYRDLEAGIFITRDPMGFVDGPNVYTYVKQNPWTSFDPDGLATIDEYEKQAGEADGKRAAAVEAAKKKGYKGVHLGFAGWKHAVAAKTARDKIKDITQTARTQERISRMETGSINERMIDDTGSDYKAMKSGMWVYNVPGSQTAEHMIHKEYGKAAVTFAADVATEWAGIQILRAPGILSREMTGCSSGAIVKISSNAANSGGRVFWSGGTAAREAAETFAKQTGGKTLEMTRTGKFLDAITTDKTYPFLRPAWDAASKRFANGAGATTDVFQSTSRGVRLESVWATKEYPQLFKQGTQINYHPAP